MSTVRLAAFVLVLLALAGCGSQRQDAARSASADLARAKNLAKVRHDFGQDFSCTAFSKPVDWCLDPTLINISGSTIVARTGWPIARPGETLMTGLSRGVQLCDELVGEFTGNADYGSLGDVHVYGLHGQEFARKQDPGEHVGEGYCRAG